MSDAAPAPLFTGAQTPCEVTRWAFEIATANPGCNILGVDPIQPGGG